MGGGEGVAHIVAIGPSMILAGPPTGHPRAEKLEPPLLSTDAGLLVYPLKAAFRLRAV